eukprot:2941031-Pyramimonas_sp.AAC.1
MRQGMQRLEAGGTPIVLPMDVTAALFREGIVQGLEPYGHIPSLLPPTKSEVNRDTSKWIE